MKYTAAPLVLLLICTVALGSSVSGRVFDPEGSPVARSRVGFLDSAEHVFTDSRGHFRIPETMTQSRSFPLSLQVSHPTHVPTTVLVEAPGTVSLEIRLERRQMFNEEVVVTAVSPSPDFAPVGS
ncbi:MAG: carboxypeptidase regulatory-like domain-containing protein, partial [Acidobacteriota bacterium]